MASRDKRFPCRGWLAAVLWITLGAASVGTAAEKAPWDLHGRLEVSKNGRYIQHKDGTPFLWLGDTAWALFYKLNREEVRMYLDDRQKRGFNVIQAVAYWFPHGEDGPGPHNAPNAYGHRPFTGGADEPDTSRPLALPGGSPDAPNDYWDHVDFILREIRNRGMYVALLPCWGRAFVNAKWGGTARATINEESARKYGQFLGQRYRAEPNVIWVIGGDVNPVSGVGDRVSIYRVMAEAIAQGVTGAPLRWDRPDPRWDDVFMTYHPDGDWAINSSTFFHFDPWLDVNGIETWRNIDKVEAAVKRDYALEAPPKPTLLLEGSYESRGAGADLRTRRQAWQAMLAGAAGHTYGAGPMWHFQRKPRGEVAADEWKRALEYPGAAQTAAVLGRILTELRWWTLAPDQALISEGLGDGALLKTAARSADGKLVLVYFADSTPAKLNLPKNARFTASWIRTTDGMRQAANLDVSSELTPPSGWADALLSLEVTTP